jgi:hypothetical protein
LKQSAHSIDEDTESRAQLSSSTLCFVTLVPDIVLPLFLVYGSDPIFICDYYYYIAEDRYFDVLAHAQRIFSPKAAQKIH